MKIQEYFIAFFAVYTHISRLLFSIIFQAKKQKSVCLNEYKLRFSVTRFMI